MFRIGTTPAQAPNVGHRGTAVALFFVVVAWFGLAGCDDGSSPNNTVDAGIDAVGDTGSDVVVDTGDAVDSTADDSSGLTCTLGDTVTQMTGSVENEVDQPVSGAKVQLCIRIASTGILRCLSPTDSGVSGAFTVNIPETMQCMESAAMRVILPGTNTATTYCDLDIEGQGPEIELTAPLVLYETTPATTMPAEGDGSAERTVVFEDGLEIDLVPDRFYSSGDGYETLAARRLDDAASDLCFLEGMPALDGLYAFSPEADVDGDSFVMRIPNTTSLDAGTTVSLYILGGLSTFLPDDTTVPEAEWFEYGTGTVSASGDVIEAALPYFSWFGYRAQ